MLAGTSVSQVSLEFSRTASEDTIQHVAAKLRERNTEVVVGNDADAARNALLERLPIAAEVHSGRSKMLEEAGMIQALQEPGRYDFLRERYLKMDRKTKAREIRKLIATPDAMLSGVNAVTTDRVLVATSATGSQLGPYSSGAGK